MKEQKYLIEGYEWFDKINGNSYFTITITDLNINKEIYKSDCINYGYGDAYRQAAYRELVKLGLVDKKDSYNHKLNRERFIFRKNENCLKRELLE